MIIGLSVMLASLAWVAYNRWMIAGKTGQSLGKRMTKIRLIGEETNAPIGAKNAFIRDLVHILDALTVVGYLWPLWDDKKQTFADKIMKTIVVNEAAATHRGILILTSDPRPDGDAVTSPEIPTKGTDDATVARPSGGSEADEVPDAGEALRDRRRLLD